MKLTIIYLLPIVIYFFNSFLKKNSLLLNYTGEKHQKFVIKEKIPLSGGTILLICFFFIFLNNFFLSLCLILMFSLGLSADLKILNSPKLRFLLQLIILFAFTYFLDLEIKNTRIIFLDFIMTNKFFSYSFVVFCILILVNGTNFIDGLNTNVLGYYLIVSFFIYSLELYEQLTIAKFTWICWIFCLFILYWFNFFKKLFIGDSGSYFLGLFYSYILIGIYSTNSAISPFFIVLLLWYPCFEILFSIVRKINFNRSPLRPDNKHLHQVLFIFIKKITKRKKLDPNTISANIINLYNLIILYLGSLDIYNSQYQIFLILVNLIFYVFTYLRIVNNINKISITSLKKKV